ncbi:MAG: sulfatase/phosphatase domain-containing protein, partial [Rikenellaceae bacterium]
PLRSGKTSVWEGGVRVPCVVRAPSKVPAGGSCDLVTSTMDILPTLASLAGAEVPTDRVIDGCDISKILHGKQRKLARSLFYYQHLDLRAVRSGKWKLYLPHQPYHQEFIKSRVISAFAPNSVHIAPEDRVFFSEPMLYDLESDISESRNVVGENPKVVERLMKELEWAAKDIGCYEGGRGVNARVEK